MGVKISIASCPDYSYEKVLSSIRTCIDLLGGFHRFIRFRDRVLIKPNLLSGSPPEKAITTHPTVVKAIVQLVREVGGIPFIGDSPGRGDLYDVAEKAGIKEVADEMNCPLVKFTEFYEVKGSKERTFKKLEVAKEAMDADVVINVPKVKTHGLTLLTLGIKNMFGCVPGIRKTQWHLKAGTDPEYFAEMLVDLYGIIRPKLTIVDGIVAMEGNGPNMGKPRPLGLIFAGADCVALDTVITEVLSVPIKEVVTTKVAVVKGLGIGDLKKIEILGEKIEDVRIKGFKTPKGFSPDYFFVKVLQSVLGQSMTPRPLWIQEKCSSCGSCVEICPPKAIRREEERLKIDYKKCIRCFCCSEICPEEAIDMGEGFLLKMLKRRR